MQCWTATVRHSPPLASWRPPGFTCRTSSSCPPPRSPSCPSRSRSRHGNEPAAQLLPRRTRERGPGLGLTSSQSGALASLRSPEIRSCCYLKWYLGPLWYLGPYQLTRPALSARSNSAPVPYERLTAITHHLHTRLPAGYSRRR